MANRFVRFPGKATSTGVGWSTASANLGRAVSNTAAGDTIYVAHDHIGKYNSSVILTFTSLGLPVNVIVVNDSTLSSSYTIDHTPLASSVINSAVALEAITSGNSSWTINGNVNVQGLIFANSTGTGGDMSIANTVDVTQKYRYCTFVPGGTTANRTLFLGATGGGLSSRIEMYNCSLQMGNVATAVISPQNLHTLWEGGDIGRSGTTQPTNILRPNSGAMSMSMEFRGVTFTSMTGTVAQLDQGGATRFIARKCMFSTTSALSAVATSQAGMVAEFFGCGNALSTYAFQYRYHNAAGLAQSDPNVSRSTGAFDGTSTWSVRVQANAGNNVISYGKTLRFKLTDLWWDSASTSVRVYAAQWVGQNRIRDGQFWVEAEYVFSSSALGGFINSQVQDNNALDIGTTWSTDTTSVWLGVVSSGVLSYATLTPVNSISGPMSIWAVLATSNIASSSEIYIDPKVDLIP